MYKSKLHYNEIYIETSLGCTIWTLRLDEYSQKIHLKEHCLICLYNLLNMNFQENPQILPHGWPSDVLCYNWDSMLHSGHSGFQLSRMF